MKIIIKETGKEVGLQIIDRSTGCEWTADLIEAGGMESDDQGNTIMSADDFDWWENYIADKEKTDDEAEELAELLKTETSFDPADHQGATALQYVSCQIAQATDNDYESHRTNAMVAMNDIRREYGLPVAED